MILQQQQAFLAQLYTDQALNERLQQDPAGVARDFNLPLDWVEELSKSQAARLGAFRKSLVGKRKKQSMAILPRSFALAPKDLEKLFTEYAQTNSLQDPDAHTRDALDFRRWIAGKAESPLTELMRFEWELAEFHRLGKPWRIFFFRFPVWKQDFNLQMPSQGRWILMKKGRFFRIPW